MFIILPIFFDMVRNLDDIKVIYGILIFAGVISAAYGLYQFFYPETFLIQSDFEDSWDIG